MRGPLFAFILIFCELGVIDIYCPIILPKVLATDAFFVFPEAARIDGVRAFGRTFRVILPLTCPAVDASSTSMFGPVFAMSVITLLPVVLFFLAFRCFLVEGVSTSGLKG